MSAHVISLRNDSEYRTRMSQFRFLLVGGSNSSGLSTVRSKMCVEGRELFRRYCGYPDKYPGFEAHIEEAGKECFQCQKPFLAYLWKMTDGKNTHSAHA